MPVHSTRRQVLGAAAALATLGPGALRAQNPIVIKFSHVVAPDTPKGKANGKTKVTLCHKAGKKWVKVTVAAPAAKQRLKKGDVAPDASGKCPAGASKPTESTSTTTTSVTTTTVGTTTTG